MLFRSLADGLRHFDQLLPPFGDCLKTGPLGLAGSVYWEPDPALDIDYHIRHSALPAPGRYRELFNLVSRLHATLLDRSRPLWEMHLIEGLQNRQFAIYQKTHHAAVDGARSVHISRSMLSPDPTYKMIESPLSLNAWERYRASLPRPQDNGFSDRNLRNVSEALKSTFDTSVNLYDAVKRATRAWQGQGDLRLPFMQVPRSDINTSIGGARRFVAQTWPFSRIRAVGKAFDGTFNDAVLAMCAGALRMYLIRHAELPRGSLKAMVPVSLRAAGDVDSGNAVASISADLSTHIADPVKRLQAIKASVDAGKAFFDGMSANEIVLLSALMQTPGLVLMPLGLAARMPPFNTVISNVPGIQQPMYWNGARLDGSYPVSIVMDGVAVNITLVTYDKQVDFGIVACRKSMPQVQRLIDYMEEALVELEQAAGIAGQAESAATKPPGKRKATAKTPPVKKSPARKASAKTNAAKAASKAPAKKTKTKRAAAKKAVGQKIAAKKASPKKAIAKKPAARKAARKEPAAPKTSANKAGKNPPKAKRRKA